MSMAAISLASLKLCKTAERRSELAGSWEDSSVCSLCEAESGHLVGVFSAGIAVWNGEL